MLLAMVKQLFQQVRAAALLARGCHLHKRFELRDDAEADRQVAQLGRVEGVQLLL